jgi:flagellar biosynthesis protein
MGKSQKLRQIQMAMALKHQSESGQAPRLVAKGFGLNAERLIDLAKENNVPIQKNENLAEMLSNLEVPEEIPEELYEIVAKLLAYLHMVDENYDIIAKKT